MLWAINASEAPLMAALRWQVSCHVKNVSSDGTRPFIPPPTREQLMAGSANLRRVYKVEA
jgi:hypothetical protein